MKNNNPNCPRRHCFANKHGHCTILIERYKEARPFFKTAEQLLLERKRSEERLKARFKVLPDRYLMRYMNI